MELIIPNEIKPQAFTIEKLYDSETNEEISTVNPGKQGQTVILEIPFEVKKGWILRRKNTVVSKKAVLSTLTIRIPNS